MSTAIVTRTATGTPQLAKKPVTLPPKPTTAGKGWAQKVDRKPGLAVQLLTAGTSACVADSITFPLDTVKVRLQVRLIY